MNSIWVDWSRQGICEEWDFVGATKIREQAEERVERLQKQHRISKAKEIFPYDLEERNMPIYNFAYPLHSSDISDKEIIKVCNETNCTVVQNKYSGEYFLALTGCGMDYSQDIALAYMIIDGWIDWDFLNDVYVISPLSVSPTKYKVILRELKRQLKTVIKNYTAQQNRVESYLKASNINEVKI